MTIAALRQAVLQEPGSPIAQGQLAMALRSTDNPAAWQEAVGRLEIAVALAPDMIAAQVNLALLRHQVGAPDEVVMREIDRALRLDDHDPQIWTDAAVALFDRGRFEPGLAAGRHALCLAPNLVGAVHAHAETIAVLKGPAASLIWFDRLVRLDPASPIFRIARGKMRLATGDVDGGWADYEARRGAFGLPVPALGDSEPQLVSGKTVLVYSEQGFGDVLQFIRFVRPLCEQGARVYLLAPPELRSLLADLEGYRGRLSLVTPAEAAALRVDLALPVMSLPRLLQLGADGAPYLEASDRQRERWRQALSGIEGLRVGLCWSGNPRAQAAVATRMTDRRRSVPFDQFGAALAGIDGATFISLQHGYRAGEVPQAHGIRDASAYIRDFGDLAGLIVNLDLVITVDTAVAHLAGALGARTWMLNRFDSCWRWERGASATRWYNSMTIFNQVTPMDWSVPLAGIQQSLRALIADQAAAIAARNTLP